VDLLIRRWRGVADGCGDGVGEARAEGGGVGVGWAGLSNKIGLAVGEGLGLGPIIGARVGWGEVGGAAEAVGFGRTAFGGGFDGIIGAPIGCLPGSGLGFGPPAFAGSISPRQIPSPLPQAVLQ
jgi:hypothetical protein